MCVEIVLANSGLVSIIDDEDAEKVNRFKWNAERRNSTPYAFRGYGSHKERKKYMLMHRYILDAPADMIVDHINGNGLDNRKSNLRLCTRVENTRNRVNLTPLNKSGINGVHWAKRQNKWIASISVGGKQKSLGSFIEKADAAAARRDAELKYYGEYAPVVQMRDNDKYDNPPQVIRDIKRKLTGKTSGVVGVSWANKAARWVATINRNGERIRLGQYTDVNMAIAARKAAE